MEGQTAPAAPTQQPSTNGSSGSQTPAATPQTRDVVSVVPTARSIPSPTPVPRAPNGQFTSQGQPGGQSQTTGVAGGEENQTSPLHAGQDTTDQTQAAKVDEWRFKDKIKINGLEQEIEADRERVRRALQLEEANLRSIHNSKKAAAEAKQTLALLKEDPIKAMVAAGMDERQAHDWMVKRIAEHAQLSMMPPEQREALQQKQAFERERQEFQKQKEAFEAQQREQYEQQVWSGLESQFTAAMEELQLPKGYQVMHTIAEVGREFLDANLDLSPKEIVAEANRRLSDYTNRYVVTLPAKQLSKLLGQEKVKELIAIEVERFKASQNFGSPPPVQSQPEPKTEEPKQYMDEYQWKKWLRGNS